MIIARPEGNNLPRYVLISFYTASAKNIKLHLVNVALFSHMAIENRKLKLNISKKKPSRKSSVVFILPFWNSTHSALFILCWCNSISKVGLSKYF